jgi:hypothetical protein
MACPENMGNLRGRSFVPTPPAATPEDLKILPEAQSLEVGEAIKTIQSTSVQLHHDFQR